MVHGLIKDPSRWVDPISRANGLGSVAATRMAVPANSKMQLGLVSVFRSLSCRVDSIEPVPLIARLTFPAYANVPAHSNAGPMPGQCRDPASDSDFWRREHGPGEQSRYWQNTRLRPRQRCNVAAGT